MNDHMIDGGRRFVHTVTGLAPIGYNCTFAAGMRQHCAATVNLVVIAVVTEDWPAIVATVQGNAYLAAMVSGNNIHAIHKQPEVALGCLFGLY